MVMTTMRLLMELLQVAGDCKLVRSDDVGVSVVQGR
jgi:hypothetical protein